MKKNVNLKITSTQYSENLKPSGEAFLRELEKEDFLEILTEGTMYQKNNARYMPIKAMSRIWLSFIKNTPPI